MKSIALALALLVTATAACGEPPPAPPEESPDSVRIVQAPLRVTPGDYYTQAPDGTLVFAGSRAALRLWTRPTEPRLPFAIVRVRVTEVVHGERPDLPATAEVAYGTLDPADGAEAIGGVEVRAYSPARPMQVTLEARLAYEDAVSEAVTLRFCIRD